jgi:hypothetical protein
MDGLRTHLSLQQGGCADDEPRALKTQRPAGFGALMSLRCVHYVTQACTPLSRHATRAWLQALW